MVECPRRDAVAGVHNCRQCKKGSSVCSVHQWSHNTLWRQFSNLILDTFTPDELRRLHKETEVSMLPFTRGKDAQPLDSLSTIDMNRELDEAIVKLQY